MAKVTIKQVRSVIGRTKRQKLTMQALGLKKMNATSEHELTPQIEGMIKSVEHLVEVTKG